MVRALAAAASCSSKQCSLATTRYACLQQRSQQQQQQKHLHDQYRVRRHAPDLGRYDALSRFNLRRFRGADTARAAGLMFVVEIRRRRVQDAMSVCVKRQHGAMPAWAMSASEVLQGELAATACFFWCFLLLLLQVLLLHGGTHTSCRVHECIASRRQRSQTGKKQQVWSMLLSREAWPIQSVRINFGQQNAAVESPISHIWLYYILLPKNE